MTNPAYQYGAKKAFQESGYSSFEEFAKHSSDLADRLNTLSPEDFSQSLEELIHSNPQLAHTIGTLRNDSTKQVAEEIKNLQPIEHGLFGSIKGMFSASPHIAEKAQAFLPASDVLQAADKPGEYIVKRFHTDANIPHFQDLNVNVNPEVFKGPDAEKVISQARGQTLPPWAIGGTLLGAAVGSGIGHFTSPEDANDEERRDRTLVGGSIGGAVGGLSGGLLGYLRGGALGRATMAAKDIVDQTSKFSSFEKEAFLGKYTGIGAGVGTVGGGLLGALTGPRDQEFKDRAKRGLIGAASGAVVGGFGGATIDGLKALGDARKQQALSYQALQEYLDSRDAIRTHISEDLDSLSKLKETMDELKNQRNLRSDHLKNMESYLGNSTTKPSHLKVVSNDSPVVPSQVSEAVKPENNAKILQFLRTPPVDKKV